MAHCWARQPRARPSFPHLAGSCLHFVNWYVWYGSSLVHSWGGTAPGRGEGGAPTLQVEKVENLWEQLGDEKVTRVFTTQASLGRGETGEGEQQESKSGKEPSRVAEDKESTREPGVRGVSCNCQLWIRCRCVLKNVSQQEGCVSRKNQLWIWCSRVLKVSYDKYVQCDPAITSYENDVVVSQQHVHIALSQDVSMISKNHRKLLRQFEIAMMWVWTSDTSWLARFNKEGIQQVPPKN